MPLLRLQDMAQLFKCHHTHSLHPNNKSRGIAQIRRDRPSWTSPLPQTYIIRLITPDYCSLSFVGIPIKSGIIKSFPRGIELAALVHEHEDSSAGALPCSVAISKVLDGLRRLFFRATCDDDLCDFWLCCELFACLDAQPRRHCHL